MQNFLNLNLPDVFVYTPQKYEDKRGLFFENFNYFNFFEKKNLEFKIIQENISYSKKNVLRGLHFQKKPYSQSKIISVIKGKILDVIVDIRVGSPTFSKWVSYVLDDKANETIYIPSGFAHGFLALEEECIVSYKVDAKYNPENECSIVWNDKTLNINWSIISPLLSKKDKDALSFDQNFKLNNFV